MPQILLPHAWNSLVATHLNDLEHGSVIWVPEST